MYGKSYSRFAKWAVRKDMRWSPKVMSGHTVREVVDAAESAACDVHRYVMENGYAGDYRTELSVGFGIRPNGLSIEIDSFHIRESGCIAPGLRSPDRVKDERVAFVICRPGNRYLLFTEAFSLASLLFGKRMSEPSSGDALVGFFKSIARRQHHIA